VPFLLSGGTARATGLGSTVVPLPAVPSSRRFLVVCPPDEISTRAIYEAVDGLYGAASTSTAAASTTTVPADNPLIRG